MGKGFIDIIGNKSLEIQNVHDVYTIEELDLIDDWIEKIEESK